MRKKHWTFWVGIFVGIPIGLIALLMVYRVAMVDVQRTEIGESFYLYRNYHVYAGPSGFYHEERIANALHIEYPGRMVLVIPRRLYPGTPFDVGELTIDAGVLLPQSAAHLARSWKQTVWPGQTAYWLGHSSPTYYIFTKDIRQWALLLHGVSGHHWFIRGLIHTNHLIPLAIRKCPDSHSSHSFCHVRSIYFNSQGVEEN